MPLRPLNSYISPARAAGALHRQCCVQLPWHLLALVNTRGRKGALATANEIFLSAAGYTKRAVSWASETRHFRGWLTVSWRLCVRQAAELSRLSMTTCVPSAPSGGVSPAPRHCAAQCASSNNQPHRTDSAQSGSAPSSTTVRSGSVCGARPRTEQGRRPLTEVVDNRRRLRCALIPGVSSRAHRSQLGRGGAAETPGDPKSRAAHIQAFCFDARFSLARRSSSLRVPSSSVRCGGTQH